ncbi:MAG TPA: hypothetical protein VGL47_02350 [Amycolatopsis sp.]|uniref:hypothetical protein n=1 Tax=Amycolatopsis sp. TaxID=37632 RepID=UPI002F415A59
MAEQLGPRSGALSPAFRALDAHMLNSDPPDHTRLGRLVGKAFTSGVVARLRPRVEAVADELLDAMAAGGALPMTVICELLGVPEEDRQSFRECVLVITAQDAAGQLATASTGLLGYLGELIERKRAEPGDDLLSKLVRVSDDGDRLSAAELVAMASLLVIAGQDTTVDLIGNGVLSLLREPVLLGKLRAAPELLPGARCTWAPTGSRRSRWSAGWRSRRASSSPCR